MLTTAYTASPAALAIGTRFGSADMACALRVCYSPVNCLFSAAGDWLHAV